MSKLYYLLEWQLQRHISSLPGKLLCVSNVPSVDDIGGPVYHVRPSNICEQEHVSS